MPKELTCQETFARVQDYLDRELSPEEVAAVMGHLERCPHCGRAFRFEESILRAVRTKLEAAPVPVDLMARLRKCLDDAGTS